jgi:hypothetical protein
VKNANTSQKQAHKEERRQRRHEIDRLGSGLVTLDEALLLANQRGMNLSRKEILQLKTAIASNRGQRVKGLVAKAVSLEDALSRASQKGIVLTEDERRTVQDALADKALMSTAAAKVYFGSNAGETRAFCTALEKTGSLGKIAAELFRVQKASTRAKHYRGGVTSDQGFRKSYRDLAYDRKDMAMAKLAAMLSDDNCGLTWGWGRDEKNQVARNVLYVELPQGQVSFHCVHRHRGPDYPQDWDGEEQSERRIVEFCNALIAQNDAARTP